ncbi:hypothetical protein [Phytomonospora endophytica]|uniref:Phage-related protein n=1 Tax=Phytomonospora endophytica TaxID=714109 RepID=A0A841FU48_9ACTN|nr:hypothetical protein [Phytomonospora endophytica]MBB6039314.1 phage-related protein [Phytomonospora endophytica]GIG69744.1 hypothetical protein Pen01_60390 [Phytomonospora endophytica]
MGKPATLVVNIIGKSQSFVNATNTSDRAINGLGRTIRNVASVAAGAFAVDGLLQFGQDALTAASDAQQAMGAVDSVFKGAAGQVRGFADAAAEAVGLSRAQYGQLSAVLGSQLKNMGVPLDALAGQTDQLVTIGADLAAQFGGPTSQAVEALSSLLRGERDPIEQYGVSISQAAVNARIAALGLDTSTDAAQRNATAQATLALLAEQTADAQGAFARESDTAAGAQQQATAAFANASAELGERMLPALTAVTSFIGDNLIPAVLATADGVQSFVEWLTGTSTAAQVLLPIIGGIVAALTAYAVVLGVIRVATIAWTAAQWLLNAAQAASPINLIILAIVALVAAVVIAYQRSETFRKIVQAVFRAVGVAVETTVDAVVEAFEWCADMVDKVWTAIFDVINGVVSGITGFFDDLIGKIQSVIDWFGRISVPDWLKDVGGWFGDIFSSQSAPTLRMAVTPAGLTAARAAPSATSPTNLAALRVPVVRVYIGDRELTGMVKTEIRAENLGLARRIQARPGRSTR